MKFVDRCIFTPVSAGTGSFVVSAAVAGYLTPADAGAVNATTYSYAAETRSTTGAITAWETGNGVYNSATLTRVPDFSSNSNALVNFGTVPNVSLTIRRDDILALDSWIVPPNLVGDGVTDDSAVLTVFNTVAKTFGRSSPETVTISITSPAVVSWTDHGMRLNEAFKFSTTGSLPTGIDTTTVYYVISAGFTKDSFQFSTFNNYDLDGEGTAVNATGSQSGVHSAIMCGGEWQSIILPPAAYLASSARLNAGQRRLRLFAHGAVFPHINFGTYSMGVNQSFQSIVFALINTVSKSSTTVTCTTAADSLNFWVGQWIMIMALDMQNRIDSLDSFPPNNHYVEFAKVTSINTGTGVLTLSTGIKNTYKSYFPVFYPGIAGTSSAHLPGGGAATIFGMNTNWDMEAQFHGLHTTGTVSEMSAQMRSITFIDCHFDGPGPFPSQNRYFGAKNCVWGSGGPSSGGDGIIEIDKLCEYIEFDTCIIDRLNVQSDCGAGIVLKDCKIARNDGTALVERIDGCNIGALHVGAGFGTTDSLFIRSSRIDTFEVQTRQDDAYGAVTPQSNFVHNWTFTGGTFKLPITTSLRANAWAVPGRKMFFNDLAGTYPNMGAPFTILDVYEDGSNNFCFDTDLVSVPASITTSSTVTISITNPAVISWASHGLTAGTCVAFKTTGALPTGITEGVPYFVLAAGLNAGDFRIAPDPAGTAVITTGSQSGTHTGYSDPLHFQPHPCPRITVVGCTGCSEVIDHNGAVDEPIYSRAKRMFAGLINQSPAGFAQNPILWGNLISLTVNVVREYTGATVTMNLLVTANGFDAALVASNLTQTIDTKTVGKRVITAAAATGSVGADVIAAYAGWISGTVSMVYSDNFNGGDTMAQAPLVEVEVLTDQGVTRFPTVLYQAITPAHPEQITDTNVRAAQS